MIFQIIGNVMIFLVGFAVFDTYLRFRIKGLVKGYLLDYEDGLIQRQDKDHLDDDPRDPRENYK